MRRASGVILVVLFGLLGFLSLIFAEEPAGKPITYVISDYALRKMKEWEVPEELIAKLAEMKEQEFSTRPEVVTMLEDLFGQDQAAEYGIRILNAAYRYDPEGRREPFEPLTSGPDDSLTIIKGNACDGPLGQFHVGEIQIIGILLGGGGDRARVKAPDGESYTIRMGDCIGKFQGEVVAFTENCVTVKETQEIQKGDEMVVREPETHLCLDPLEEQTVP